MFMFLLRLLPHVPVLASLIAKMLQMKGRYEPSRASRAASASVKSPSPRTTTNTPPEFRSRCASRSCSGESFEPRTLSSSPDEPDAVAAQDVRHSRPPPVFLDID